MTEDLPDPVAPIVVVLALVLGVFHVGRGAMAMLPVDMRPAALEELAGEGYEHVELTPDPEEPGRFTFVGYHEGSFCQGVVTIAGTRSNRSTSRTATCSDVEPPERAAAIVDVAAVVVDEQPYVPLRHQHEFVHRRGRIGARRQTKSDLDHRKHGPVRVAESQHHPAGLVLDMQIAHPFHRVKELKEEAERDEDREPHPSERDVATTHPKNLSVLHGIFSYSAIVMGRSSRRAPSARKLSTSYPSGARRSAAPSSGGRDSAHRSRTSTCARAHSLGSPRKS